MRIPCPLCGLRDEMEFSYGGEAHIARPDASVDDASWSEYLYFRENISGIHAERWRHSYGCGQWFNLLRDTTTHMILRSYPATAPRPDIRNGGLG